MTSIPTKHKAWVFEKHGPPLEVLKSTTEWPTPVPSGDQILINVKASSINPVDWKSIAPGPMSIIMKKPAIPNSDFSGVVVGGKLAGTGLELGMEVYGILIPERALFSGRGSLAEYILASPNLVLPKPANISFAEAASIPLASLTGWQALVETAQLKSGDRVFINGGSGGTGVWGILISKALGAHVVTTCSNESRDLLKNLGADETIDYRAVDVITHLSSEYSTPDLMFDIIYDCVGNHQLYYQSKSYLKPSGRYADIAPTANVKGLSTLAPSVVHIVNKVARPAFLGGNPRKYHTVLLRAPSQVEGFRRIDQLLREGKIKPVIDSIYSFDEALKAYERQMTGRSKGKVVIKF